MYFLARYDTSEMDESCKSLTRTLTGLSHNNSLVQYRTFVKFPNGQNVFLDGSVFCKDPDLRSKSLVVIFIAGNHTAFDRKVLSFWYKKKPG